MPKLRPSVPPIDPIEKDFRDALQRLVDGKPTAKVLRARASKGTLKINVSSVALEAAHSRTLIGVEEGCRYPSVRALVFEVMGASESIPRTHTELINTLRSDKAELAAQVEKYKSEALAHFQARTKAEALAMRHQETVVRLRKEISSRGKIVSLVPPDDVGGD